MSSTEIRLTGKELREGRGRLGLAIAELAAELEVTQADVRAWEAGSAPMPPRCQRAMRYLLALRERDEALAAAGLPPCEWVRAQAAEIESSNPRRVREIAGALADHLAGCEVCRRRSEWAAANLPPLPSPVAGGWARPIAGFAEFLSRWPRALRPAVVGAVIMAAMTAVRGVLLLPALLAHPVRFLWLLAAIGGAAAAGACGGLIYALVRPTLRRLGRPGDYLTGIVCMAGYLGAFALAMPLLGEPLITSASDAMIFALCTVFSGLVIGHSWFGKRGFG